MSLWSDWKAGLLEDSEYTAMCRREELEDRDRRFREWNDDEEFKDDDIDEF